MLFSRFALIVAVLSLGVPLPTKAHPHAWIAVRTSVILNDNYEVVALRQHWLFDKAYSTYAISDFDPHKNGKLTEADLLALAKENLQNLKKFSYFTVFEDAAGQSVKLQDANDIASTYEIMPPTRTKKNVVYGLANALQLGMNTAKQIAMEFTVPLAVPIALREAEATYRIYDPTYYVSMAHYEHTPVTFISAADGSPITSCHSKVELPQIDQAMINSAAALDKNATAPKDLGYYFSEKVTLTCSPLE
jgi:ABC-type uncharacterized transport system substrate-binding protein